MAQSTINSNTNLAGGGSPEFLRALNIGQILKADGPVQFGDLSDRSGTQNAGLFDKIFGIVIFQSINNQTRFFRCLAKNPWNELGEVGLGGTVGWRIRRDRTSTFQGTAGSDSGPLPPSAHNRADQVERLPHYLMARTSITSYADYIQRNAQNQFQISEPFTYQLEIMRQDMQKKIEWLLLAPATFPSMTDMELVVDGNTAYVKCELPEEVARTLMPDDRFQVVGRRHSGGTAAADGENPYRATDSSSAALNNATLEVVRVVDKGGNNPSKVLSNIGSGLTVRSGVTIKTNEVIFQNVGTTGATNVAVGGALGRFGKGSLFVIEFRKVMTSIDDIISESGTSLVAEGAGTVHPQAYNLLDVARRDPDTGKDNTMPNEGRTSDNNTGGIVLDAGNQDLTVAMLDDALAIMRDNGALPNLIIMDQRTQKVFSRSIQTGTDRFVYPDFVAKQTYSSVQSVSTLKGFDYRQPVVAYQNIPIIDVDDAPLAYLVKSDGTTETRGRNVYILDTRSIDVGIMLPTQVIRAGNPILLDSLERQVLLIQLMDLRVKVPAFQGKITNLANVEPNRGSFSIGKTNFIQRTDEEA